MRVLFLTRYTATGPSSRYRVLQFLPFLERAGIECVVRPLLDDRYLEARFSGRSAGAGRLAAAALSRAASLCGARRYDVVFVQKELFPWLPPLAEWALSVARARVILDIDDAIHLPYRGRPLLAGKVPAAIARATLVLAGNRWLADYARAFNPRTIHFPTVVDTARFTPRAGGGGEPPVVGWMGSPETVRFLDDIVPALRRVRTPFRLRVVGAPRFAAAGLDARASAWTYDGEADELRGFDLGVMPLRDDEWARGKCSLKLLQYMSAGLATVSSPAGSVRDIVDDGVNGCVASAEDEWVARLEVLLGDAARRAAMGARARERVIAHYSLARYGPRLAEIIRAVGEGREAGA